MDIEMPIMDGFEACRKIKSTQAKAPVIVMLTAGIDASYEERRERSLADTMVAKPLEENELFRLLSRHLGCEYTYSGNGTS